MRKKEDAMAERLFIFDTTLRDGQQTQGVDFSIEEKISIMQALDGLGVDYIEGGWPGANPTDSEFFESAPKVKATFTAFGMTKRSGRSAENDDLLAQVVNAGTPAVCLVGKSHDFHVKVALKIEPEENIACIEESIRHLVAEGREAIFDAEHFFDGYKSNPGYALSCLKAAYDSGARWIVLCDTNGGALPSEVGRITSEVIESGLPGDRLGIHAHNDTENAVANSLAAVDAGVRQVQGTLNGLGERCGNANLTSLIPTLMLKEPYAGKFELGITPSALTRLTRTSRMLDDILNRVSDRRAPYVGASAFAHKAGLHASAIVKDPTTYEHVEPMIVGNTRYIPMSNQAGQSNLRERLARARIHVERGDPRLAEILSEIKAREDRGYAYDAATASFELLARRVLGQLPRYFEIERYRVDVEKRRSATGDFVTVSEAVVVAVVGGKREMYAADSFFDGCEEDKGPVHALSAALRRSLEDYAENLADMKLVDFKVRITRGGTDAVTRVIIDSEDSKGKRWSTVGVSANIVDASFQALTEAMAWKMIRDGVEPL